MYCFGGWKTPFLLSVCLLLVSVSAGALYSGVQVQRVGVWELLCDLLVHVVQTTGVGESLVPRAQQRGPSHEGEPSEKNETSCSLPAQAIRRWVHSLIWQKNRPGWKHLGCSFSQHFNRKYQWCASLCITVTIHCVTVGPWSLSIPIIHSLVGVNTA